MEEGLDSISCYSIEALEINPLAPQDLNFRVVMDESVNLMSSDRLVNAGLHQQTIGYHDDLLMRGREPNRVLNEYPADKPLFLILGKPLPSLCGRSSCG